MTQINFTIMETLFITYSLNTKQITTLQYIFIVNNIQI